MRRSGPPAPRIAGVVLVIIVALVSAGGRRLPGNEQSAPRWTLTSPIVTYWGGPDMTDRLAAQLADGGWNLVWCGEADLDTAQRHRLRCQLRDPLLAANALSRNEGEKKLRDLIRRVRQHPALYAYYLADEPGTESFPPLQRLVALIRQEDPAHFAYINLLPTYATNAQLGTLGNTEEAYQNYLRRFVDEVAPDLLSFDHYNFLRDGDRPDYFLNLALVRRQALASGLPFLNIVQASGWGSSHRVPTPNELRFLVYTSLAYGAQGLSYYVYSYRNHVGGLADAAGVPTVLFAPVSRLNREFVAIAQTLQPLRSVGTYHVGARPSGTTALPANSPFRLDLARDEGPKRAPWAARGLVIGLFARPGSPDEATYALVVNADYETTQRVVVTGSGRLEGLSVADGSWTASASRHVTLSLGPGDGRLVRVQQ